MMIFLRDDTEIISRRTIYRGRIAGGQAEMAGLAEITHSEVGMVRDTCGPPPAKQSRAECTGQRQKKEAMRDIPKTSKNERSSSFRPSNGSIPMGRVQPRGRGR
jgi:hypothetical protein